MTKLQLPISGRSYVLWPTAAKSRLVVALAAVLMISHAQAADLRFAPTDHVVLNRANDQGMFDFVIHTIGIQTGPRETLTIKQMRIDVLQGEAAVLTKIVPAARMVGETQGLTGGPERIFLPAQLLTAKGPDAFFGASLSAADAPQMKPSQYLITTRHHFSVDFVPTQVRVTVENDGPEIAATLPVRRHETPITYMMPLDGSWSLHSLPMIASHHRLNPSTEFAVDFFKTDDQGRTLIGDPAQASNALGYGAPVKAAADGEVVFVIADEVQDRTAYLPRPGEDARATGMRIGAYNMKRYAENMPRAAAGNIVTLKHENNGVVEYSSYGHLKAGSVRLKLGDKVAQGQVIGEVGDTGDSPAVHLHFQINAGADAFTSKSLPVQFSDMKYVGSSRDPARFVTNER